VSDTVTLGSLVEAYVAKKIKDRIWSPTTAYNNNSTLQLFVASVREIAQHNPDLRDIETPLLRKAIEQRWPDTGEKSTHATNYNRVRTFMTWVVAKGYETGDIDAFLGRKVKLPDLEKKYTNRAEMKLIEDHYGPLGDWWTVYLCQWGFESHRRPGETARMLWKDIDFRSRPTAPFGVYWYRETKNERGRQMLELTETEAEILREWRGRYTEEMGEEPLDDWYVFPARRPTGATVKGQHREMELIPGKKIGRIYYQFAEIFKAVGVYVPGKAGHSTRRGGMEEAFRDLEAADVDDVLGAIMPRSGHATREIAAAYLDRDANRERSRKAYLERDKRKRNPEPAEEISTENPDTIPLVGNTSSNVYDFSSRLRARA
jgi:integrase